MYTRHTVVFFYCYGVQSLLACIIYKEISISVWFVRRVIYNFNCWQLTINLY
nr:MAG TPA: hypothetical protein [Caudoviricetes sp.]